MPGSKTPTRRGLFLSWVTEEDAGPFFPHAAQPAAD